MSPIDYRPASGCDDGQDHVGSQETRLFEISAVAGLLLLFAGPLVLMLLHQPFLAGTTGYAGIILFAGAIAARYGFIEHPSRWIMLLRNLGAASVVGLIFYAVFVLIYVL